MEATVLAHYHFLAHWKLRNLYMKTNALSGLLWIYGYADGVMVVGFGNWTEEREAIYSIQVVDIIASSDFPLLGAF